LASARCAQIEIASRRDVSSGYLADTEDAVAKVWSIVAGLILAIVFGPAILAFLIPATTRSSTLCFIFGSLQIGLGVTLYLLIYAGGGVDWPWLLLITLLGVYHVWRGMQLRQARAPPREKTATKSQRYG
jgi:hypothetical protein